MSTFAVLASEDFESKQARSRALTATIVRAQEMFDPYLSKAVSAEDKADRVLLIEDDLKRVAYAVSKEYGYEDYRHLYSTARHVLGEWEKPWEKEDKDSDDKSDKKDDDDKDDEKKKDNPFDKEAAGTAVDKCPGCGLDGIYMHKGACPQCGEVVGPSAKDIRNTFDAPTQWGQQEQPVQPSPGGILPPVHAAAEPETADTYQSERVDLPSNSDTGLGGPSPKIDKGSAGDVAGTSQKPIDIGSKKHQHELQNATDRADYNAEDFVPSASIRTQVDADKPMQPEFTKAPATDTWSGTDGQAKPVTSKYEIVQLA